MPISEYRYPYAIYGLGGHAKVVHEALCKSVHLNEDSQLSPVLFVHPDLPQRSFLGRPVIPPSLIESGTPIIIAIGDNLTRRKVVENLPFILLDYPTVIHPSAQQECDWDSVDQGCHLLANSFIGAGSSLGEFCIINTAATIDHDCKIGNFVHIAPGVRLCGNVSVGDDTIVGVGSSVIPGIRIGKNCVIGGGSVVVNDIPDNTVAFGNPCRVVKYKD